MKKIIILLTILISTFFSNVAFADIIIPECENCPKCPEREYKTHNITKYNYHIIWVPIMILLNFILIFFLIKLIKRKNKINLIYKKEIWKK